MQLAVATRAAVPLAIPANRRIFHGAVLPLLFPFPPPLLQLYNLSHRDTVPALQLLPRRLTHFLLILYPFRKFSTITSNFIAQNYLEIPL